MSHEFGSTHQFPDGVQNWHGQICKKCGIIRYYGKRWGSNRYPGFSKIPLVCDEFSKTLVEAKQLMDALDEYQKYVESEIQKMD